MVEKIKSIACLAVLALNAFVLFKTVVPVPPYLRGDANRNGKIEQGDLDTMCEDIRGNTQIPQERERLYDLNGDGAVDAFDAAQLDREIKK